MSAKDFNLLGKDYFDQTEAAHYCCLSLRQFQMVAAPYGIQCVKFGGKLLYRRHDLQRAIENEWRLYDKLTGHGYSTGEIRRGKGTATRSGTATRYPKAKRGASLSNVISNSQPDSTS